MYFLYINIEVTVQCLQEKSLFFPGVPSASDALCMVKDCFIRNVYQIRASPIIIHYRNLNVIAGLHVLVLLCYTTITYGF